MCACHERVGRVHNESRKKEGKEEGALRVSDPWSIRMPKVGRNIVEIKVMRDVRVKER